MRRLTLLMALFTTLIVFSQAQRMARNAPLKLIQLPQPKLSGSVSIEEALAKRRSVRDFSSQPLDFAQLGQLAWAAQGITEPNRGFRTAPSAGAIYPMEIYFAIEEGLFLYQPDNHSLQQTLKDDIREDLSRAALGQPYVAKAPCDIIITGSVQKLAARYRRKAEPFALLEAGHIAQNIHLQAVGLGLGSVPIGAFEANPVRKICNLSMTMQPFYIIPVGYPAGQPVKEIEEEKETLEMDISKTKKAALIIASNNFRDEELFETQKALNDAKIQTTIVSSKVGIIRGMLGGRAKSEIFINELKVDDYQAIIFIGGSGAKEYFNNNTALGIAKEAKEKEKVLGAICIAPTILANAGLLDGVRATSYSSERVKLKKAGANFTSADVERDGLIITGNGPTAAAEFGQVVVQALQE